MKRHTLTITAGLALSVAASSALGLVIASDPFASESSADLADPSAGIYRAVVDNSTGDMAGASNADVSGGPIIGFGVNNWSSSTSTYRSQLGNLDTASRVADNLGGTNNGAVRVLTFKGSTGAGSSSVRTLERQLDPFAASSTYYMAAATNIYTAAAPGSGGYFYLGFGDSAVDGTGLFEGIQWGYRTNAGNDGIDFVMRARNAAGDAIDEIVVLANVPGYNTADTGSDNQFLVVKVEVNPGGADTITYWLDPALSGEEPVGGITVTTLNAFDSGTSLTHFGAVTSLFVHAGGNNSTNRIGYFDSIALGTEYMDVVGVPEPATFALLAGGLALALILRRRRAR
jgi:hypothetical protein